MAWLAAYHPRITSAIQFRTAPISLMPCLLSHTTPWRLFTYFLALCGSVALNTGVAQTLYEATMAGQVQNITKDGTFVACGYRIVVTSTHDSSNGRRVLDVLLLQSKGGVVTKFVGRELPRGVNGLHNLVPTKTFGGWLKSPGKKAAAPLTEVPEGVRNPPPSMRLVETEGAIDVLDAVSQGKMIQVAVNWSPELESIYFGKVEIKQSLVDQFRSCVEEVTR